MKADIRIVGMAFLMAGCGAGSNSYQPGLRAANTGVEGFPMTLSDFDADFLPGYWVTACTIDPIWATVATFPNELKPRIIAAFEFTASGDFTLTETNYLSVDCATGTEFKTFDIQGQYSVLPRRGIEVNPTQVFATFQNELAAEKESQSDSPACSRPHWEARKTYDVTETSCNPGRKSFNLIQADKRSLTFRRYIETLGTRGHKKLDTVFYRR